MKETTQFKLPDNAFANNPDINRIYEEACQAKQEVRKYEKELKEAKQVYTTVEEQLIDKIKATGGSRWERAKGFSAGFVEKIYYSFTKNNRLEVIELVTNHGRDDLVTVNTQSLGGFLRSDFQKDDESEVEMSKRLPEFVNHFSKLKITLRQEGKVV